MHLLRNIAIITILLDVQACTNSAPSSPGGGSNSNADGTMGPCAQGSGSNFATNCAIGTNTTNTNTTTYTNTNVGTGKKLKLTATVMRLADDSVKMEVKIGTSPWKDMPLSVDAREEYPEGCIDTNDGIIEVRFIEGGKTTGAGDHKCVVGFRKPGVFYIGYDNECDEAGTHAWRDIDDVIVRFTCEGTHDFAIKDIWASTDIKLEQWTQRSLADLENNGP